MRRPLGRSCLTTSWLFMISWAASTYTGVHSFHTNYPPNPARYYLSSGPKIDTTAHVFAAPTPRSTGNNNQARRPAFVLHESFQESLGSMTNRAFGMFSARGSNPIKKKTSLSVSASHQLEPRPPSTPPPLDVVILQERWQDEVEFLAGKVLGQIPPLQNDVEVNRSKNTEELANVSPIGVTDHIVDLGPLRTTGEVLNEPIVLQASASPSASLPTHGDIQRPSISRMVGRLAGTVFDQVSAVKKNLVKQIRTTRIQTITPLKPKPPKSPPPTTSLSEEPSRIRRIFSRVGGGVNGGNRQQEEPRRKQDAQKSTGDRKNPKKDDDDDGDDDKFSFEQRIESIKTAIVGALSGGVASTPFIFLHDVALADSSANGIAQWEFDTDMGSLEAALFALVYRYAVREDTNPMLQQGAVGAFVLVRTLSRIQVSPGCDAIPLSCGDPLGYFDWSMISEAILNGAESAALFGAAAVAMEACFNKKIISKFP